MRKPHILQKNNTFKLPNKLSSHLSSQTRKLKSTLNFNSIILTTNPPFSKNRVQLPQPTNQAYNLMIQCYRNGNKTPLNLRDSLELNINKKTDIRPSKPSPPIQHQKLSSLAYLFVPKVERRWMTLPPCWHNDHAIHFPQPDLELKLSISYSAMLV